MGKIIVLDENTANKIAAGEVIEKPASVIKELVENSIDAGAANISVEIRNGGISFIRVTDNGSGLEEDDVEIAFERHATSKIRRADDLESIKSMGFRGEALASIAAVSDVQLTTRVKDAVQGVSIDVRGGAVIGLKPAGCPTGTSITVKELFFNTPARYKFLKKDSTEAAYIADIMSRIALGYPDISFKLTSNGTAVLHTPGNGDLKSVIFSIYGSETSKHLLKVDHKDEHVRITGYVGGAEMARSNRSQQLFYINGRTIRSKTITSALDAAYATYLMKNKYAFAVLDIRINPASVDVNVHPSKMEVKFSSEQDIYRAVYHAVNGALLSQSSVRTLPSSLRRTAGQETSVTAARPGSAGKSAYHLNDELKGSPAYSQQDFEWVRRELERKRTEAVSGSQGKEVNRTPVNEGRDLAGSQETGLDSAQESEGQGLSDASGNNLNIAPENQGRNFAGNHGSEGRTLSGDPGKGGRYPDGSAQTETGPKTERDIEGNGEAVRKTAVLKTTDWKSEEQATDDTKAGRSQESYTFDEDKTPLVAEAGFPDAFQAASAFTGKPAERTNHTNLDIFSNARVIGQVFSTYIILEGTDELFLLDQHAAHERIRYEELKKAWSNNEQFSQLLLSVINIELSAVEYQFAVSEIPFFTRLGFTYESFGSNSIILRSVPFMDQRVNITELFIEILDFVMNGSNPDKSLTADEALYRMACKSAVKANKKLDVKEIDALLERLASLENPFTCPHGRPAILRLRRYELEKLFKRIV